MPISRRFCTTDTTSTLAMPSTTTMATTRRISPVLTDCALSAETSWALANDRDADDAWSRERHYAPGYTRLLGRGIEPDEDETWRVALADLGLALKMAMDPDEEGAS